MTKRILIVGPAWIGDMVMAQSLFKILHQKQSNVQIDVLAPAWTEPVLMRMPEVHNTIQIPIEHGQLSLSTRRQIGLDLRKNHYDQAIILPRSFKSAITPFFAKIPQRTGFRGEMRFGLINDMRELDKTRLTQTVQRYVALGLEAGAFIPGEIPYPGLQANEDNCRRILQDLGLTLDQPVVGIMPGAEYGPAKRWPAEYFADLALQLAQMGYQVWQFGSHKDRSIGDKIKTLSKGSALNLCGETSVEDAIDLISLTKGVITNDSGLMHIAAALNRPVLAIYGSSSPSYTPPLTDKSRVLYLNLECSPCFKRECPHGHYRCLKDISVDMALNTLRF